jgi:8-oxo-dGTP diphosphatase
VIIKVAVGVIINTSKEVLMTQRALSLHQGGLWEFPGGKVEPNESIQEALTRELKEEINVSVQSAEPLITIQHHYPDKSVQLHVYLIKQYTGIPQICDGQLDLQWISLDTWRNDLFPVPASNLEIMRIIKDEYSKAY